MPEDPEPLASKRPSFDPNIQTEDLAFRSDEMVTCSCGRMNPPNRLKCLYCGRELDVDINKGGNLKATLRPLEMWERGFNVVFTGPVENISVDLEAVTTYLSLEHDKVRAIFDDAVPMPLVRVENAKEAAIVERDLEQMGFATMMVSDADLASAKLPARLSGIIFETGALGLRAFNTGGITLIPIADLVVMVSGIIATGRVEAIEKKRRGSTEVLDETATMSDEAVLDIYARGYPFGFRVNLAGFDFSCLGSEKELLASGNLVKLISAIRSHAPDAAFVDNYQKVRHSLNSIWEIDTRKAGTGLQRSGFARRDYGSVTRSSNLDQFTRYSRLQRHLYEAKG